ncbi:hypothetical protein [Massilia sp. CCM 8734]|uniref:hypothetical protein n=1 Tax=Massilia sp. CCM 8734 TaxID=2609283 RepID=UPI001423023C|nr:hypothetical protein [Massilia sp. CCM 8734]NHZ96946.1 hypothetical protein [Massilia sp. CCM 8734]
MDKFAKVIGVFCSLLFCFFAFVSFNFRSTSTILSGMIVGSEFYEKTQNAMLFLMIFLIVNPLQVFIVHALLKKGRIDALKKFVFISLVWSIMLSLAAYYFSGVFPFRVPTITG